MGTSHGDFIKYPRTPHRFGSAGTADDKHLGSAESQRFLVDDSLIVEDNQGHVIQVAREQCRELMRSGTSFAFSATNVQPQTRSRWIDLFADYGARVEIVYIEPALSTILAQNQRRERQVPESVIRELAEGCEPPTWTEGHGLAVYDGATLSTTT